VQVVQVLREELAKAGFAIAGFSTRPIPLDEKVGSVIGRYRLKSGKTILSAARSGGLGAFRGRDATLMLAAAFERPDGADRAKPLG